MGGGGGGGGGGRERGVDKGEYDSVVFPARVPIYRNQLIQFRIQYRSIRVNFVFYQTESKMKLNFREQKGISL